MVFWIIISVVVLIAVWFFIDNVGYDFVEALVMSGGALLVGAMVGGTIFFAGFAWWMWPSHSDNVIATETYDLAALGTDSQVEGRFYFLGGGYVGESRTLNYIKDDEGAFSLESIKAKNATVYQDSDEPTVTLRTYEFSNGWLMPFSAGQGQTAEFHVPEGSILTDYQISND